MAASASATRWSGPVTAISPGADDTSTSTWPVASVPIVTSPG